MPGRLSLSLIAKAWRSIAYLSLTFLPSEITLPDTDSKFHELSIRVRTMASVASTSTSHIAVKDLAQKATQANKDHQYALKVYSERLESELEALEKLLVRGLGITILLVF